MNKTFLIGGLICIAAAGTANAQPAADSSPRYTPFTIDPDFENVLKKRLRLEKQLEPLKDLIRQFTENPDRININLQDLKGIKFDDEDVKKELQRWVARDPELQEKLSAWAKKNAPGNQTTDVKELQKNLDSILKDAPERKTPEVPKGTVKLPEATKTRDETLMDAATRAMKKMETTQLGEWVRESPSLRRAVEDLQKSMTGAPPSRRNWADWADKLRLPEGKILELGKRAFERLRDLPHPNVERWTDKFHVPDAVRFRPPEVSLPALPRFGTPALPTFDKKATWLLFGALFGLTAWQVVRWRRRPPIGADERIALGPWPVRPEAVSTRADLVRAFDYLALLTLGLGAQSWNHRTIVRQWRQRFPSLVETTAALGTLYERARYADDARDLTPSECDQTRQCLLQIAEGA